MKKQMIEVQGLPEGWKAVAYRLPKGNIEFVLIENVVREAKPQDKKCLIVEKIQPRRIVLEDTGEERSISYGDWYEDDEGDVHKYLNKSFGSRRTYKIWREVKETDIPLTNDEPYLKFSVDDAKQIYTYNILINQKIIKFIKENS